MKRAYTIAFSISMLLCAAAPLMASASVPGQISDTKLRYARARVERDIDMLQRDRYDYAGHRVAAIKELQEGRAYLLAALKFDARHEDISALPLGDKDVFRGDYNSDANLMFVRRDVERTIDILQKDNRDYGGNRAKAIAELQQGRKQIQIALAYDKGHERSVTIKPPAR